jgi:hypothetical protein
MYKKYLVFLLTTLYSAYAVTADNYNAKFVLLKVTPSETFEHSNIDQQKLESTFEEWHTKDTEEARMAIGEAKDHHAYYVADGHCLYKYYQRNDSGHKTGAFIIMQDTKDNHEEINRILNTVGSFHYHIHRTLQNLQQKTKCEYVLMEDYNMYSYIPSHYAPSATIKKIISKSGPLQILFYPKNIENQKKLVEEINKNKHKSLEEIASEIAKNNGLSSFVIFNILAWLKHNYTEEKIKGLPMEEQPCILQ